MCSLYRSGESVWETEREPYHLLRVLCHLVNTLMDSPPPTLQAQDRWGRYVIRNLWGGMIMMTVQNDSLNDSNSDDVSLR